jgi:glutathione S-transferase
MLRMGRHFKLVSHRLCPYVQRAAMMLLEKGVAYETVYVDLANKPEWFLAISPRGKVPVLLVDGTPVFESQAICELLEELVPEPRVFPADPILRARDRGWFAFASDDLFPAVNQLSYSTEPEKVQAARHRAAELFARMDPELVGRKWLSGDGGRFGMADLAMAPALSRLSLLERLGAWQLPEHLERVGAWLERVLERPSTRKSVPADFEARMLEGMRSRGSLVAGTLS